MTRFFFIFLQFIIFALCTTNPSFSGDVEIQASSDSDIRSPVASGASTPLLPPPPKHGGVGVGTGMDEVLLGGPASGKPPTEKTRLNPNSSKDRLCCCDVLYYPQRLLDWCSKKCDDSPGEDED